MKNAAFDLIGFNLLSANKEETFFEPELPLDLILGSATGYVAAPRENFESLKDSIELLGVLVPVLVVRPRPNQYFYCNGHGRISAAKALGLSAIPALVHDPNFRDARQIYAHDAAFGTGFLVDHLEWVVEKLDSSLGTEVEVVINECSRFKNYANLAQLSLEAKDESTVYRAGSRIAILEFVMRNYLPGVSVESLRTNILPIIRTIPEIRDSIRRGLSQRNARAIVPEANRDRPFAVAIAKFAETDCAGQRAIRAIRDIFRSASTVEQVRAGDSAFCEAVRKIESFNRTNLFQACLADGFRGDDFTRCNKILSAKFSPDVFFEGMDSLKMPSAYRRPFMAMAGELKLLSQESPSGDLKTAIYHLSLLSKSLSKL